MIRTDLGIATAYAEAVSKGYTGTRDEFGQMFVDFGKTAEKVTEDKKSVEQMKASVEEKKNSVDTTAAEFGQNVADKTEEAKAAITEHANTEKASATDAIASAKDSATSEIAKKGTDTLATIPEDYTSLNGQVSQLKEDIVDLNDKKITKFYASNQGENHLADSDNGKIQDMVVYGKSSQNETTGKNLLKIKDTTKTVRGVTITSKDGIITVNGTATETGWAYINIDTQILADGTYIANYEAKNNDAKLLLADTQGRKVIEQNVATALSNAEIDKVCFIITKGNTYNMTDVKVQLELGSSATSYEPYTGGQPSPSPDYPQEIKSVVNPTVKVSNEDGTKSQTVTLPYTLNAIPVSSGGNVTIDGQQYIADYVDVERGKIVRNIGIANQEDFTVTQKGSQYVAFVNYTADVKSGIGSVTTITNSYNPSWETIENISHHFTQSNSVQRLIIILAKGTTLERANEIKKNGFEFWYTLQTPIEEELTTEEIAAFKALATHYPVTNISANSEQLDGYTMFNYPISLANGWNYVKQQLNDNRDYIYDMDLQSAEAYVNSEYAVALTELEV